MHDNSGERVLNFGIFFLLLSYDLDHLRKDIGYTFLLFRDIERITGHCSSMKISQRRR